MRPRETNFGMNNETCGASETKGTGTNSKSGSVLLRSGVFAFALLLSGCATYEPLALSDQPALSSRLSKLNLRLPAESPSHTKRLNPARPIAPDQVGLLAVANDPDLVSERAKIDVANADLLTAKLLPNPSLGASYAFLVGGPATAGAVGASISQDIRSIITYRPRVDAATARSGQVRANVLWQEWQVAQKARLLAVAIHFDDREIALRKHEIALLTKELKNVQAATAAGNLDLTAEAPIQAAQATAERDLATAELSRLKDWQDLDALLGLQPSARFKIAAPPPLHLPRDVGGLIASISSRRPDLVALRLGYAATEADVRLAILEQFPAFSLGGAGGSDTSQVVTAGPQLTMDLPIFDQNQGKIAAARATRAQLRAEYQARLDTADGTARSLLERSRTLLGILARTRKASRAASDILASATQAYAQGDISQRDITDFETTAIERKLDAIGYERSLEESALGISIELGIGFPETEIGNPPKETTL